MTEELIPYTPFKWSVANLFAIPVFNIPLLQHERDQLVDYFWDVIYKEKQNDSMMQISYNSEKDRTNNDDLRLTHYYNEYNVFEYHPTIKHIGDALLDRANFVYRNLLNFRRSGPMRFTQAWFNLANEGDFQYQHSHSNCVMSGTTWLNTDENTSIIFNQDLNESSGSPRYGKASIEDLSCLSEGNNRENEYGLSYHNTVEQFNLKNNDCFFWPSSLLHGYSNNKTKNRLSLSFNMIPAWFNATYQVIPGVDPLSIAAQASQISQYSIRPDLQEVKEKRTPDQNK